VTRTILALALALLFSNCGSIRSGAPLKADGVQGWKQQGTWHGRDSVDLAKFDRLVPASQLRDRDFPSWVRREGAGTPGILWRGQAGRPFVSEIGTALPVTYIENESGGLDIYDVLQSPDPVIDGKKTKLAVNYTAPLAYMRKQGDLKLPVVRAMIKTEKYIDEAGIYRFEPVDPNRIPVIFVHGIKSSPSIWKNMVNRLRADEVVRDNYQFWSFSYPTGLPILYSGMRLRQELIKMQEIYNPDGTNTRMNQMVVIGHSMGGLVTELQVKDSGYAFWPEDRSRPDDLGMKPSQAKILTDSVFFKAVPQISRAVFIATPHRGSDIAGTRVGEVLSRLISLPTELTGAVVALARLDPFFKEQLGVEGHIPNSVDDLEPGSQFLIALRGIKFNRGLPIHSIIALGEKEQPGLLEDQNDGLVSYRSAHLKVADSEKTIQTNHRAPNHPEAISEVVRILRLHLVQ